MSLLTSFVWQVKWSSLPVTLDKLYVCLTVSFVGCIRGAVYLLGDMPTFGHRLINPGTGDSLQACLHSFYNFASHILLPE